MDNLVYSNMLMINELKDIINQIEMIILEKNNMNISYNEKLKTLYEKYESINRNFRKSFNIKAEN
jgi:hypothetical protein